jgi:Membrane bound O-acyl transferase family
VNTNEVFAIAFAVVVTIYAVVKVVGVARGPLPPAGSLALFLVAWPGVRTDPFAARRAADPGAARLIGQGAAVATAGALAWWLLAATGERLPRPLAGWLGVAVLLTTFHCGLSDVVSGGLRRAGYPVRRLFRDPLASRDLREFWSSRWNIAFVEMNQVVFLPWLRRHLGRAAHPAVFVLSGLLHELAISLPVGTGFGLPTAYFTMHAAATHVEQRLGVRRWPGWAARLWTWALIVGPLPLLFHRAFRDTVVLPLFGGPR